MTVRKRLLALATAAALLYGVNASDRRNKDYYRPSFVIQKGSVKYSRGTIYIGDNDYLDALEDLAPGDILVEDDRTGADPDLRVRESSNIHNLDIRHEIICALLCYEEVFPTDWERSEDSMINEWIAHNFLSMFNYKTHRTNDVDFNNKDEDVYKIKVYN